jgi:predicted RNase H-like nuclease
MPVVAGLDGCRGGWMMVRLDTSNRQISVDFTPTWQALDFSGLALAAVDMPIGLADTGPRACDLAARALLPRGRKSSVFAPPRRYMLACRSWESAHLEGRRREGVGLSKQSWNLIAKIDEIDRHIEPRDQERLREVHPELVFHNLNGWRALPPKKTSEGAGRRRAILARHGIDFGSDEPSVPRRLAGADDLLDAAACALAAEYVLSGRGCRLPPEPTRNRRGLRMEIWY